MQKKLVIGLGITGRAVARHFTRKGFYTVAVDSKSHFFDDMPHLDIRSDDDITALSDVDLAVLSPGIPMTHPLVLLALEKGVEVIGEIELAMRAMNRPIIAITGTNGKTTVTALVAHVLYTCGHPAKCLGNIGMPLIEDDGGKEIAVLELSSFQLESIRSKKLLAAVILNITPDHLDRYHTLEKYAAAKFLIQDLLIPGGKLIIEADTAANFSEFIKHPFTAYSWHTSPLCLPESLAKRRNHDAENLIAAYLLCLTFGINEKMFLSAAETFEKAPHRIEYVKEFKGLHFWNDSKGTNIDATLKAVDTMEGDVVLIAGGVDKGAPYTPWAKPFKEKVRSIVCIGEAAEKMVKDLSIHLPVYQADSLSTAVLMSIDLAETGDNILLSPGCSSYDMFHDYVDRGNQFKSLVRSLT